MLAGDTLGTTGKTVEGRPELATTKHLWLYSHLKCETGGKTDVNLCPITGITLRVAMEDNQFIIVSTRVLERAEPLRFRIKDPPGACKVWTALINKVPPDRSPLIVSSCQLAPPSPSPLQECAKYELPAEHKKTEEADSAERDPTLWKWSGKLDELMNRRVMCDV